MVGWKLIKLAGYPLNCQEPFVGLLAAKLAVISGTGRRRQDSRQLFTAAIVGKDNYA
jgi:hypothetical protein